MLTIFKNKIYAYNVFILCYIALSYIIWGCLSYPLEFLPFKMIWVITSDDRALFIHLPLLLFFLQLYVKFRYKWLASYSIKYLTINMLGMSIISYLFFFALFFIFVYDPQIHN